MYKLNEDDLVLELRAEGGGVSLFKIQTEAGQKYVYEHREFDPTDEDKYLHYQNSFDSFADAFAHIRGKYYYWFRLGMSSVDAAYKTLVRDEYMAAINEYETKNNGSGFWGKESAEEVLEVTLMFDKQQQKWFYKQQKENKKHEQ